MPAELLDVLYQGLRAFYIIGLPIIIALSVTSILVTILQTALGVQEHTIAFAARVVALMVLLYAFLPNASQTLMALLQLALK